MLLAKELSEKAAEATPSTDSETPNMVAAKLKSNQMAYDTFNVYTSKANTWSYNKVLKILLQMLVNKGNFFDQITSDRPNISVGLGFSDKGVMAMIFVNNLKSLDNKNPADNNLTTQHANDYKYKIKWENIYRSMLGLTQKVIIKKSNEKKAKRLQVLKDNAPKEPVENQTKNLDAVKPQTYMRKMEPTKSLKPKSQKPAKKILSLERLKKFTNNLDTFLRDFGMKFNVTQKIYKELNAKFLTMKNNREALVHSIQKSEKNSKLNEKFQKQLRSFNRDFNILSENLKNAFLKKSLMDEVSKLSNSLSANTKLAIDSKLKATKSASKYWSVKKNKTLSKVVE